MNIPSPTTGTVRCGCATPLLQPLLCSRRQFWLWWPYGCAAGARCRQPGRPQRLPRVKYLSTVLLHPIDGFREMRNNGMGSTALANGIMAFFFLVSCLDYTSRRLYLQHQRTRQL